MARVKKPKIGIGITTHNRYEVFKESYDKIVALAPKGAQIVVIDDASKIPCPEATYRFESNVGIAAAKNKCFELLDKNDHIFLFDDDTYPICKNWYKPYIESPEGHLAYHFFDNHQLRDNEYWMIWSDSKHRAFPYERGCMLYYKKACLEIVGGMDWRFGKWGWEHPNLADRIFNAGLTTFRNMDVVGSDKLIYSGDENGAVERTTTSKERNAWDIKNGKIREEGKHLANYVDYRAAPLSMDKIVEGEDIVITSYFTGFVDPQRKEKWEANYADTLELRKSLKGKVKLVIINDCFDEPDTDEVIHVKVEPINVSPYFARWAFARRWLRQNENVGRVWIVDATDVTLVNSPFEDMKIGTLYTGDEHSILANEYMLAKHPAEWLQSFMKRNATYILLNAGLLGGDRYTVLKFLMYFMNYYQENFFANRNGREKSVGDIDMGLFNYVARTHFANSIVHGRKVSTVFKRYQNTQGSLSWWKHK